jgi:regulatory protein
MNKPTTPDKKKILQRMQHLCAMGEKCRFDIEIKLKTAGLQASEIQWVLDKLISEKFIDEARFAGFFVRDKFRLNHWGRIKISYALRQKHLDQEIISNALAALDEDEYLAVLRDDILQKNRTIRDRNIWSRKAKLYRFAAGRGFEQQLIHDVVEDITGG